MKIAIGSDHGGLNLKSLIKDHLASKGIEVKDFGTHTADSVDYPDYGEAVGEAVVSKDYDLGILICGTGLGISMAANKVRGVIAACVSDCFSAEMAKAHNNANILAMGERVVGPGLALRLVDTFLETEFEGGRHANRVNKIIAIQDKNL